VVDTPVIGAAASKLELLPPFFTGFVFIWCFYPDTKSAGLSLIARQAEFKTGDTVATACGSFR
jgi:hypothetical protein